MSERLLFVVIALSAPPLLAQSSDSSRITVGAFADVYYAHDFNGPPDGRVSFTTQAPRSDRLAVNLAFVEARLMSPRVRGRLAAQYGTSADVNYAAERNPNVRYIQEAFAGYRVARRVWVDAGIMLAPFGSESWVSSDNWTYTRSLVADNCPYYEAGARGVWSPSPSVTAQLHVMNGWQIIGDNNRDKALGARVDYSLSPGLQLAWNAFLGNEQPSGAPRAVRVFNEIAARSRVTSRVDVALTLDHGRQSSTDAALEGSWWGGALLARYQPTARVAISGRAEAFDDSGRLIVATSTATGLRAVGVSGTLDVTLVPMALWRLEWRELSAVDAVFPRSAGGYARRDVVLLSSLSVRRTP